MAFIKSLRRSTGVTPSPAATTVASRPDAAGAAVGPAATATRQGPSIEISPSDALHAYLQAASGVVEVDKLELDSPALTEIRAAGVKIIVPLVTQGELIGALYLGPRLSDQDYSSDDRRLLNTLAAQAAPAIRVAQLVREQAIEIQAHERLDQELRLATLIQQQFLPHSLPDLAEWQVAAYYGPARAVGGDFYDFIELTDGRIGIVVGDVTDKGVPAALIMARTHSILRSEAPRLVSPGAVLARANELLCAEMPANMFVTCLYAVLEPEAGRFTFANAGHNLPYVRNGESVTELRATGMPLGLMPGMVYDETTATIGAGESLLLYSDGLVEAHDPNGEMYGFPRLQQRFGVDLAGSELIDRLLDDLRDFTGPHWEQEDDLTLVTLRRSGASGSFADAPADAPPPRAAGRVLLELAVPGAIGNERMAMDRVAEAVASVGLAPARLERLKTAVSEAAMNAIEYGSEGRPEIPVLITVTVSDEALRVRISDHGLGGPIPDPGTSEVPDLEAKLAGLQKPRGWGIFLIGQMVDQVAVEPGPDGLQTAVLTMDLTGGD